MLPAKGPPAAAAAPLISEGVLGVYCWRPPERSGAGTGAIDGPQAGLGKLAGWQAPAAERLAGIWVAAGREKKN